MGRKSHRKEVKVNNQRYRIILDYEYNLVDVVALDAVTRAGGDWEHTVDLAGKVSDEERGEVILAAGQNFSRSKVWKRAYNRAWEEKE